MSAIFVYWPLPFSRPLQRNKVKESGDGRSLPVGGSFESELLPFVDFSRNSLYPIRRTVWDQKRNSLYANSPKTGFSHNRFFVSDYKEQARSGPKDFPRCKYILL